MQKEVTHGGLSGVPSSTQAFRSWLPLQFPIASFSNKLLGPGLFAFSIIKLSM